MPRRSGKPTSEVEVEIEVWRGVIETPALIVGFAEVVFEDICKRLKGAIVLKRPIECIHDEPPFVYIVYNG